MTTTATPTDDGHYLINGEKLWCTNGTRADLFVVMARTPDRMLPERQGAEADHGLHRRGRAPRHHGEATAALHGPQGHRERAHPVHERQGPEGEHPLGRRQGPQARAGHAEHRPAHDPGRVRGHREVRAPGVPPVGRRARAVGRADRQARGHRQQDRPHGGRHVRAGGRGRAVHGALRTRQLRHPPRGRDGQDVEHRDRLAHRRRRACRCAADGDSRPRTRCGSVARRRSHSSG